MLIRYPGSKDKHLKFLASYLEQAAVTRTVCEPFAGTASITFHLLANKKVDYYHINDADEALISLWKTVRDEPDALCALIEEYTPTVEDFYEFKKNIGVGTLEQGFRKLALHQMSYSGLGGKAGGPLGGREQKSAYLVDCRWSPKRLISNVRKCSQLLNSVPGTITNNTWEEVIETVKNKPVFIYLDPPYYVKGEELYINGSINHELLAESLKNINNDWVLSYDDTPEIRELYSYANVQRLDVLSHLHHKIIGDVAVTPR